MINTTGLSSFLETGFIPTQIPESQNFDKLETSQETFARVRTKILEKSLIKVIHFVSRVMLEIALCEKFDLYYCI